MLCAQHPLLDRQQRGELIAGPCRIPRLARPGREVATGVQDVRVLRAEDLLVDGQQRGELVPGPARIPRPPGPAGEVARPLGFPGSPRRRPAHRGHQRGELVPGPGRIPRLTDGVGQLATVHPGVLVLRAEDSLLDGKQRGELIASPGRIPACPVQEPS